MSSTQIYKGYWWVPDNPEDQLFGELILFDAKYAELSLYDNTYKTINTYPIQTQVDLWYSTNNLCLSNCICIGSAENFSRNGGYSETKFRILGPITENSLVTDGGLPLEGLQVQFDNKGYLFDIGSDNAVPQVLEDGTVVPAEPQIHSNFMFKGEIVHIEYKINRTTNNSIGIKESKRHPAFLINLTGTHNFAEYREIVLRLQRYLTLISGENTIPNTLTSVTRNPLRLFELRNVFFPNYKRWHWQPKNRAHHIITTVLMDSDLTLLNWFKKYEELEIVINLFFTTLEYDFDEESKFILLTQGLEAYYYDKGEPRMNKSEYRTKRKELLNIMETSFLGIENVSFRDVVKTALEHGNQKNLKDMLIQLLGFAKTIPERSRILTGYDLEELADLIKNTRNNLTHRDNYIKVNQAQENLADLIPRVQRLLAVCLLKEIGLTQSQFSTWFN